MSSNTLKPEQLIEEALSLTQEGVYSSIRQATRSTGAPQSTVYHRRAGRLPRSQILVHSARLTSRQGEIMSWDWMLSAICLH
jgi:hypothetical protein